MAVNYKPAIRRTSGGDQLDVASSGNIAVASGGSIVVVNSSEFTVNGGNPIGSTGILSSGALVANAVSSTGTGTFAAVTSTGTGTFNAVSSTGTGTFNAVTSTTGTGTFNAVTSTGTGTFAAVTSTTGTGTFNAVSSTGTGTFAAVTSTGTNTGLSFVSTGNTAFNGGSSGSIAGGLITASSNFVVGVETAVAATTGITNYGVSFVVSTANAADHDYTLVGAPTPGMIKWIFCNNSTSGGVINITSTAASVSINNLATVTIATGSINPQNLMLVGQNSTNWLALSHTAQVTFA